MFYDVIVIGAGLAGLMAAEAAQSQGARVLILARGMGSLPLTTGCIDGLGYFPRTANVSLSSPLSALPQLKEDHPHHPYAIVGQEKIMYAMARFQELCRVIGLPYAGTFNSTLLLPTPLGTYRPTCLVPETMNQGNLSIPGPVLLLGFRGFKDFSPFLAAENLNILHSQGKIASSFRAEVLEKLDLGGKAMNGLNLARAFDGEDFRNAFVKNVQPILKSGERLGLPAVLGFHSPAEVLADLKKKLQADVFEIPMPPPSVPGIRLFRKLQMYLQEKGVRIILGLSTVDPRQESKRLLGFTLGFSKKSPIYQAAAIVLATGKFAGGGLDSDRGRIFETLLGLPIKYPQNRREWFRPRLLAAEGQPFNCFGVEVNENLQPVDPEGRVIYSNLFAAGAIIAHGDSMSEKSGGGIAISTGYLAGKLAAEDAGIFPLCPR
ncbi:MAG: anaerobic glycerol-3-phosphate dehydrogenase subunit GlpB [Pseudomonadota bacterium]